MKNSYAHIAHYVACDSPRSRRAAEGGATRAGSSAARGARAAAASDSDEHRRRRRQLDGRLSVERIPRSRPVFTNPINPGYYPVPPRPGERLVGGLSTSRRRATARYGDRQMYDPSMSPLPLITRPGPRQSDRPAPPSSFPVRNSQERRRLHGRYTVSIRPAFHLKGLSRVRMNPDSTKFATSASRASRCTKPTCSTSRRPTRASRSPGHSGLAEHGRLGRERHVLAGARETSRNSGRHLTDVNAAASRHPTLATVWLGANDVLKYMGSGGRFVGGDRNAGQAESDLRATISTLQHAGARVVVANLPNILETGYFQRVTNPKSLHKIARSKTYAWCL